MKLKTKFPDLSKHMPESLNIANVIESNMCRILEYGRLSQEDRERQLYESLRKKYEEN